MLELRALELSDMETVRGWRAGAMETLRTPILLTREQQESWYRDTICDRRSTTRYWGLYDNQLSEFRYCMVRDEESDGSPSWVKGLIGYGGIENIEWENRRGEISLLIGPDYRGRGYGREAVRLFLDRAFNYLNLEIVWGECYTCGHPEFWSKCVDEHKGQSTLLPARKYYAGAYYASLYFTFSRQGAEVGVRELANGGRV